MGKLVWAAVGVGALLATLYSLHIPLPLQMAQRGKMHIFELIMRLVYFYPMKGFSMVSPELQLVWTRSTLSFFAKLLGPWTNQDPALYILDTEMDGVPARVYHPREVENDGAIIFIHGGGFVLMDTSSYDGITRQLAKLSKMVVVSIEYRLAPEHVFPAGVVDCERAVKHFLAEGHRRFGVDPEKVVIMGDSAGGNLAAVTSRRLKDVAGLPNLKMQVLLYPVMQYLDFLTPSYQLYYKEYAGTSLLDPSSIARWLMLYLGVEPTPDRMLAVLSNNHTAVATRSNPHWDWLRHEHLPESFLHPDVYFQPPSLYGDNEVYEVLSPFLFDPDFSPLVAPSLAGLPPALVVTCQYDILRDEGFWYAKRLRDEGIKADWKHYDAGFHAIINFHTELELGMQVLRDVAQYVRENV